MLPSPFRAKVAALASETNFDVRAEPPMNKETERRLRAFCKDDIDRLAQLLDLDLSKWLLPQNPVINLPKRRLLRRF